MKELGAKLEVYEPHFYHGFDGRPFNTFFFGWISETSAGNFTWWDIWSINFRWPFVRHLKCFIKDSEEDDNN